MKNFIVFCYARTGSYRFMDILNRQDGVIACGEVYKKQRIELDQNLLKDLGLNKQDISERDGDPIGFYHNLASICSNQHFGFKIFPEHNHEIKRYLAQSDDLIKIYLVRNPIQSYISSKVAQKTGKWVAKKDSSHDQGTIQIEFSSDEFGKYLSRLMAAYSKIKIWASASNENLHTLDYSDALNPSSLSSFIQSTGLPCSGIETEHKKIITKPYDDMVSNWDEATKYFDKLGVDTEMSFLEFSTKILS